MHVTVATWHWLLLAWLEASDLVGFTRASNTTAGANSTLNLPSMAGARGRRAVESYDEPIVDLDDEDDESLESFNSTEPGSYVGGYCINSCSPELDHVICDTSKNVCTCEKKYPVRLGKRKGCAMPKALGDQCFYAQTCSFYDSNAVCMQVGHNAACACKMGYHIVGLQKGVKRAFCSEDVVVIHTNLPSLLVVASGIAVLSGLLCFVLKLFSSNRYGNRERYGDANLAPPLIFSSDNQWINGIPLTVHRPSSRTSSQRSTSNLTQYRSKGVLVPASRAGAARAAAILLIPCHLQNARTPPCREVAALSSREDDLESSPGSRRGSISSIHSNASSHLSYSQRRFDQENIQREQRAAMRAARAQAARSAAAAAPTPSPVSTDHLLTSTDALHEDPLGISSTVLSVSPAATPNEVFSVNELAISDRQPQLARHVK